MEDYRYLELVQYRSWHVPFDTPDLATGYHLWTAQKGDSLLSLGWMTILEPFDGTTPQLGIFSYTDSTHTNLGDTQAIDGSDENVVSDYVTRSAAIFSSDSPLIFHKDTPIHMIVDDGSGNDPGATKGEIKIVMVIATRVVS